jgi:predicted component of type VI protein secretion system
MIEIEFNNVRDLGRVVELIAKIVSEMKETVEEERQKLVDLKCDLDSIHSLINQIQEYL